MQQTTPTSHSGRKATRPRLPAPLAWARPDIVGASIAINLLALALPIVVLQVYDRVLPNRATETFTVMVAALVGVALLDGLLRLCRSVVLAWQGVRYEYGQYMRALGCLLHADMASFERESRGAYLDKLQGLDQIREFHHGQSILMLLDAPFVLAFLWLIWLFTGQMVLIPLAVIGGLGVVSVVSAWFLRRALEARSRNDERRQNFLIECLQGIHTLKALAMEPQMQRRYERLQAQSADAVYVLARLSGVIQGLGATFSQGVMVTFVAMGATKVVAGEITIGVLAAGTMLAGRVLQPTLRAIGLWSHLQSVRLARRKFEQILALPSEAVQQRSEPVTLAGGIELADVHFRHPGADEELLKGVSVHVAPGEALGITGANGTGKSTLLDVIVGFVRPSAGRVLLDGRDLRDLDGSSVRAQIALVPQRGVLFDGTLLENMTFFREGEAIDQAVALARKLGLEDTITRLPDGLDTAIDGSIADKLSAGFRQRIIMVRALLGDPAVVLFDDANAAFDTRNDRRLQALLEENKGRRTQIIVSHRPSILRICDRVLVLENGYLVDRDGAGAPAAPASDPRDDGRLKLIAGGSS